MKQYPFIVNILLHFQNRNLMDEKHIAESELIINADGSIFHLHLKPENITDKVILVGDPERASLVASHF